MDSTANSSKNPEEANPKLTHVDKIGVMCGADMKTRVAYDVSGAGDIPHDIYIRLQYISVLQGDAPLSDAVCDAKGQEACDINNGSWKEQLEYLKGLGWTWAEIRDVLGLSKVNSTHRCKQCNGSRFTAKQLTCNKQDFNAETGEWSSTFDTDCEDEFIIAFYCSECGQDCSSILLDMGYKMYDEDALRMSELTKPKVVQPAKEAKTRGNT